MSSTFGGNYTARYAYTNLGQLWQGPQNGTGTQEQYLYCDSSHPHQLSNLSEVSSSPTCSSKGTIDYTGSYDAWGNTSSQQRGSTTKSTAYDAQDHLLHWSSTTNSQQEWYLYDASGERVLRRSFDGTTTTLTVYAFGIEEHQYAYSGSGSTATNTGNTYYYTLAGRLLGTWDGTSPTTTFLLTDSLGSVVSSFNNPASGAVMQGNQLYGPYGNQRLKQGSLSTNKGFTGQYNDGLTGLDYYHARYYDPTIGLFLSADSVQGNAGGMDPYVYVGGNPETRTDPTGMRMIGPNGDTAWINPNGTIYEDTPTTGAVVIGHTHPWFSSSPGGSSTGGHTNPKVVKSTQSHSVGCNSACGKADKVLILSVINHQSTLRQLQGTAFADGFALAADIIAAVMNAVMSNWSGFVWELASATFRAAALAGDLSKLGVFLSLQRLHHFYKGLNGYLT